jgi:hypothetical protein
MHWRPGERGDESLPFCTFHFAFFILHSIRFAASPGARERYQGDHRLAFADRF